MVFRVCCGGGEGGRGTLWGGNRVLSVGNVVVSGAFCRGAGVDSWTSSVHVCVFPGDVVVSRVFREGSLVVWGQLCDNVGGRLLLAFRV